MTHDATFGGSPERGSNQRGATEPRLTINALLLASCQNAKGPSNPQALVGFGAVSRSTDMAIASGSRKAMARLWQLVDRKLTVMQVRQEADKREGERLEVLEAAVCPAGANLARPWAKIERRMAKREAGMKALTQAAVRLEAALGWEGGAR